jgi:hypothetical protein
MKKDKLFKFIDLILIFWGIIFTVTPFINPEIDTSMIITSFLSGLSIIGYLVHVVFLRRDRNKMIERELQATLEVEVEQVSSKNGHFIQVKQKILENMIESELKSLFPSAKILKNIYVPKSDGTTSEIDLLMISVDGIFLFEAKNYTAKLTGDWSSESLIAQYPNGVEIKVQNPVIQNSNHFLHLSKLLGINKTGAIKNIVVLGEAVLTIKDEMKSIPNYASVCKINDVARIINNRSQNSKNIFKESQVLSLFETIKTELSSTVKKENEHVKTVSQQRKPL